MPNPRRRFLLTATLEVEELPVNLHSLAFDGTDDHVKVADASSLDVGDIFTLSLWVKRGDSGRKQTLIDKGTNGYYIGFLNTDDIEFSKGDVAELARTTTTITNTSWHHVAATKNGSTVKLYIDGADVTGTVTNATLADTATDLHIGIAAVGIIPFAGNLDDVRIYGRELSAGEISTLYAGGNPSSSNLRMHLKFDDGTGTTAADSSGNNNNGTLLNGVLNTPAADGTTNGPIWSASVPFA